MHASSARPLLDSGNPAAGVSPFPPRRRRIPVRFGMGMRNKVAGGMRERLAAILETSDELQRNRFELIRQMRHIMGEIRAMRHRLLALLEDHTNGNAPSAGAKLARTFHLTPREVEVAMLLA